MRTTRVSSPFALPWHWGMPFECAYALAADVPREYRMVLPGDAAEATAQGEWRVHRPGEMAPIEAAALRAAALRGAMR